jgi:hypothetical protein
MLIYPYIFMGVFGMKATFQILIIMLLKCKFYFKLWVFFLYIIFLLSMGNLKKYMNKLQYIVLLDILMALKTQIN